MDIPSRSLTDLELSEIIIEDKKISFKLNMENLPQAIVFKGELDETGTKIEGTVIQGEDEGTFSLVKGKVNEKEKDKNRGSV